MQKHRESRENAKIFSCPVCRTKYTSDKYLQNHENTVNHRLMSLGQFVPHHKKMLNDKLIGQFKCPHHDDANPRYFVLNENCAEHIKTHKSPELSQPIDRLDGMNCSNLGIFTCYYCKFKTDFEEFSKFHIKAVHEKHLNKPETDSRDAYSWKKDLNRHFKICGSNEPFSKGNYACHLCGFTFVNTGDTIQHLLGPFHVQEYKNATKGIIKNVLLTTEIATKALELINKHRTRVSIKSEIRKFVVNWYF